MPGSHLADRPRDSRLIVRRPLTISENSSRFLEEPLPSNQKYRYAGLINQGQTSYMNSVLQILFFTKLFREGIYRTPTCLSSDELSECFEGLRRLFHRMESAAVIVGENDNTIPESVSTENFTQKLGPVLSPRWGCNYSEPHGDDARVS